MVFLFQFSSSSFTSFPLSLSFFFQARARTAQKRFERRIIYTTEQWENFSFFLLLKFSFSFYQFEVWEFSSRAQDGRGRSSVLPRRRRVG